MSVITENYRMRFLTSTLTISVHLPDEMTATIHQTWQIIMIWEQLISITFSCKLKSDDFCFQ